MLDMTVQETAPSAALSAILPAHNTTKLIPLFGFLDTDPTKLWKN